MRRRSRLFGVMASCVFLVACGSSGDSQQDMDTSETATTEAAELTARLEVSAAEPFAVTAENAELTCQRATVGSPFRAQWRDPTSGVHVLVTGWPDPDGAAEHRVDNFQVFWQPTSQDRADARLSGATLSVESLSSPGAVTTYAVEAIGTFAEGGTFTASGNCIA